MPPVDDYLHRQLIARRFWEAPQPLLPVHRVQQSLGLRDGREVAEWLRGQGATLAWDRLARWLTALANAGESGHLAVHDPAALAFQDRALAHLCDHLEDAFAGQVYPPPDAARRRPNPDRALLRAAAATFLTILADASLLPGGPGCDLSELFRDPPLDHMARDTDVLAELMPAWLEQLFPLLAERLPTYPVEARWQIAHATAELAQSVNVARSRPLRAMDTSCPGLPGLAAPRRRRAPVPPPSDRSSHRSAWKPLASLRTPRDT